MLGLPALPRTLDAALRDIAHERPHVRRSALGDLVRLAESTARPRVIAALGGALLRDPTAELRADAAVALADCGAHEARAELLAGLDDAHVRVRQMVVLALGEVAEPSDVEIVKAVRELLTHDEPSLRFQALIAFERLGGDAAGEALVRAAGDADLEVRSMAFRLADRRYESSAPPVALVTAARRVLDEPHSAATATAALFLSAHGERAADSALVAVLAAKLPVSDADLQAVMETVAELGIVAAREPLARRAFGAFGVKFGAHGWNACIALSRLGDERASRAILRRLRAWNRDTRTLAVVAAGRARLGAARQAILEFRGDARRADPEAVEEALSMLANVG